MMEPELKAFLASSCLHLLVAGSAVSFAAFSRQPETPMVVECTIDLQEPEQQGKRGGRSAAAPFPAPASPRAPRVTAPTPEPVQAPPLVPAGPVAASTPVSRPIAIPAGTLVPAGSGGSMTVAPSPGRQGSGLAPASDAGISSPGSSARGEDADSVQKQYLKEHFAVIRSLIAGNLRYPGKARRMGWCGKLTVEFVVRMSGEVEEIRVVKSSGFTLLDCNAVETVRRSAPFPRPPASARLLIPVEYRLE